MSIQTNSFCVFSQLHLKIILISFISLRYVKKIMQFAPDAKASASAIPLVVQDLVLYMERGESGRATLCLFLLLLSSAPKYLATQIFATPPKR